MGISSPAGIGSSFAAGACRHFEDQFTVQVLVVRALHIRYLGDDPFRLVHRAVAKGQSIFAYGQPSPCWYWSSAFA